MEGIARKCPLRKLKEQMEILKAQHFHTGLALIYGSGLGFRIHGVGLGLRTCRV